MAVSVTKSGNTVTVSVAFDATKHYANHAKSADLHLQLEMLRETQRQLRSAEAALMAGGTAASIDAAAAKAKSDADVEAALRKAALPSGLAAITVKKG